jgi:hypothetical protein
MNERIEQCLYLSGLTAQGCWDELDAYAKQGIYKFAELIVRECVGVVEGGRFLHDQAPTAIFAKECSGAIKRHFGVTE